METPQQGAQTPRGGAQRTKRTKQFGATFTANQSAPGNDDRLFVVMDQFSEVQWVIVAPSWATAYTVHFMRMVEVDGKEGATEFSAPIQDEAVAVAVAGADLVYYQYVVGQKVMAYIDGIAGVADPANPFRILYTGVNKAV